MHINRRTWQLTPIPKRKENRKNNILEIQSGDFPWKYAIAGKKCACVGRRETSGRARARERSPDRRKYSQRESTKWRNLNATLHNVFPIYDFRFRSYETCVALPSCLIYRCGHTFAKCIVDFFARCTVYSYSILWNDHFCCCCMWICSVTPCGCKSIRSIQWRKKKKHRMNDINKRRRAQFLFGCSMRDGIKFILTVSAGDVLLCMCVCVCLCA